MAGVRQRIWIKKWWQVVKSDYGRFWKPSSEIQQLRIKIEMVWELEREEDIR